MTTHHNPQLRASVCEAARAQLADRRATKPEPVDQSSLPAGREMTFYCKTCGHVCDVKPELYLFPPNQYCSECRGMISEGWLDPTNPSETPAS